jgi:plasmid stability protein
MANISIRKLDKHAYEKLRLRAKEHGVSMEEEARCIIYQAVATPARMSAVFKKHFGPKNGIDLKLAKRKPHQPLDFNE